MSNTSFSRWLAPVLDNARDGAPAVFVNGPRQAGKSTLVKRLTKDPISASYTTLDDLSVCAAAIGDPLSFIRQLQHPAIIDEVQRAPDLFRALKLVIDEQREKRSEGANGHFILTGSANIMALPGLADALVGRMRILTLLPLSMGETMGCSPMIASLFQDGFPDSPHGNYGAFHLADWVHRSTYPEVALMPYKNRAGWYQDYLTTILQRDIRQLAEIDKIFALPGLLKILALRTGGLVNDAAAARDVGLNTMTYRRYRALLHHIFLLTTIPPWHRNVGKRLAKSPKLFFYDTGLLNHLLDTSPERLKEIDSPLYGHMVENFVATELIKQLTLSPTITLYHYRTEDGQEVDFILEGPLGQMVGLEVKAKSSVTTADFAGLRALKERTLPHFKRGIVLYSGDQRIAFGPDMTALPITALAGQNRN